MCIFKRVLHKRTIGSKEFNKIYGVKPGDPEF